MDVFEGNTLTENALPITIPAELVGRLDTSSSYSGNVDDVIHVWNQSIVTKQTWKKLNIPYFFRDSATYYVKSGLTIAAGAKLIFSSGAGIEVSSNGYLNAVGTETNRIVFTGFEPLQGYWGGIKFYSSNSSNNKLDYTIIEFGGNGVTDAVGSYCYSAAPTRFVISNSTIKESLGWGVFKDGPSNNGCIITLSNNTYANNAKGNVNNP